MARLSSAQCTKVFIQRDFSDGTAVRFQNKFPQELEGKVQILISLSASRQTQLARALFLTYFRYTDIYIYMCVCVFKVLLAL